MDWRMAVATMAVAALAGCGVKQDTEPQENESELYQVGQWRVHKGWDFEGLAISSSTLFDIGVVQLADGRWRAYGGDLPGILSQTSSDGLHFTAESGVRIPGMHAQPDAIRLDDGRTRLYTSSGTDATHPGLWIESFVSTDALSFAQETGHRLEKGVRSEEATAVAYPRVVRMPDGRYRMYYMAVTTPGTQGEQAILSATSADGLTWTREAGVRMVPRQIQVVAGGFAGIAPYVGSGGTYRMYIAALINGVAAVYEGVSSDGGLTFTVSQTPIIRGPGGAHTTEGAAPEVTDAVPTPDGLRLFFLGGDATFTIINRSLK